MFYCWGVRRYIGVGSKQKHRLLPAVSGAAAPDDIEPGALENESFPCKIRTRSRRESRRDPGEILAAGIFLPSGNLAGIPARIPARFSPGNEITGGQNLAGILPRISPRFSPGSKNRGGQNLGAILPRISPRFSPVSNNPGGQNLAGMLPRISPRFSPKSKFMVAKLSAWSCRESRQDWRREAKFLVRSTAGISAKF